MGRATRADEPPVRHQHQLKRPFIWGGCWAGAHLCGPPHLPLLPSLSLTCLLHSALLKTGSSRLWARCCPTTSTRSRRLPEPPPRRCPPARPAPPTLTSPPPAATLPVGCAAPSLLFLNPAAVMHCRETQLVQRPFISLCTASSVLRAAPICGARPLRCPPTPNHRSTSPPPPPPLAACRHAQPVGTCGRAQSPCSLGFPPTHPRLPFVAVNAGTPNPLGVVDGLSHPAQCWQLAYDSCIPGLASRNLIPHDVLFAEQQAGSNCAATLFFSLLPCMLPLPTRCVPSNRQVLSVLPALLYLALASTCTPLPLLLPPMRCR